MDRQSYNGWPNVFTWQVYTHLSSYVETYDAARALIEVEANEVEAAQAFGALVKKRGLLGDSSQANQGSGRIL